MGKVIKAIFDQLGGNEVTTESRYQYDYGMVLKFGGAVTLPQAYEVHFALDKTGDAVTQIGGADGVTVPDSMFTSGSPIYAWVYLHDGETDGYTQYTAIIPVIKRAAPSDQEPTPVQQSAIDQAIAALGVAVEQTAADVETTTEKAAEAQASAEAAAASAAEAAETAENVEENVTAARAAKAAAEAARDRAVQAETSANQSKTAAATSEANAAASATAAAASASAALTSEENANGAMMSAYSDANRADTAADTATSAKNDAVTAKNQAQSAKTSAETAATTATQKASAAATSADTATTKATAAANSATAAAGSATAAANSATEAATTAQGISEHLDQIDENTDAIDALKEDFATMESDGVVPSAEQILTDKGVTDCVPYHYRKTGGDGAERLYDQIVGGTVCWNQLLNNMRSSSTTNGLTFVNNNGAITITGTITEAFDYDNVTFTNNNVQFKRDGSKYLLMLNKEIPFKWGIGGYGNIIPASTRAWIWTSNSEGVWTNGLTFKAEVGQTMDIHELKASIFDLTAMLGSTIADYIYQLEQTHAGDGVAFFKALFPNEYYPYNAGELVSVSGLSEHKMTGFNQFDKSKAVFGSFISDANGNAVEGANNAHSDYIDVIGGLGYYIKSEQSAGQLGAWYDSGKNFISGITGYNSVKTAPLNARYMRVTVLRNGSGNLNTFCVNISDSTKNGTYEPYKAHSYPLDSTLTLRGLFKLDANNQLYADGDTYDADGTVTRRYGVVDLGTFDWEYVSSGDYFKTNITTKKYGNTNIICSKYKTTSSTTVGGMVNGEIKGNIDQRTIYIKDSAYTDATAFKTAMSGVMLVYELETPTTEEAEPYQHLQQCDPDGTEEYVSTGIVPVGHNSFYPENLRAKVEQLPWNFANLIAPTESGFKATRNYTTGQLLIVNNVLYKATANIANGATITPNTNVTATTLADVIAALS